MMKHGPLVALQLLLVENVASVIIGRAAFYMLARCKDYYLVGSTVAPT